MTEADPRPQTNFNTTVRLINGTDIQLPVSQDVPLFIVGPNGAGKSGIMLSLYHANLTNAVRISAHRQTSMESNHSPFSPKDKADTEVTIKSQDALNNARWMEWNALHRTGLVIANLIDADNAHSRKVRDAIIANDITAAKKIALTLPPLDVISDLLAGSGIPIKISLSKNNAVVATKRDSEPYSIASLSDGERAALLIAGMVMTAPSGSLILIDEPEKHLHGSISAPLLLQLFAKRLDCTFVVSTHDLTLPVACPSARIVLIRNSTIENDKVVAWDLDILEPGLDINDADKASIIGSKRKLLFIEGTHASLDKPLYELLFPGITIAPRSSRRDVEHAVASIRDTSSISWVEAFGIIDQDQLTSAQKSVYEAKGIYPLAVYSVESLYYNPLIVEALAHRQSALIGANADTMIAAAWSGLLGSISADVDRLSARLVEQAVKDAVNSHVPTWKQIQQGCNATINVDVQVLYQSERSNLLSWLAANDVNHIVARYPIRETKALEKIVTALQFKGRIQYEAAVRKMVSDDTSIKTTLIGYFGNLSSVI